MKTDKTSLEHFLLDDFSIHPKTLTDNESEGNTINYC